MNRIGKAISTQINKQNISISDLAQKAGWKNVNKFCRRLKSLYHSDKINEDFLFKVAHSIQADPLEIKNALHCHKQEYAIRRFVNKTERMLRERENFKPFIELITSPSVPSQITYACLTGGKTKFLSPPKHILQEPLTLRVSLIKKWIPEHYRKSKGICPFFGKIIEYRYQFSFDRGMLINVQGQSIQFTSVRHLPEIAVYHV